MKHVITQALDRVYRTPMLVCPKGAGVKTGPEAKGKIINNLITARPESKNKIINNLITFTPRVALYLTWLHPSLVIQERSWFGTGVGGDSGGGIIDVVYISDDVSVGGVGMVVSGAAEAKGEGHAIGVRGEAIRGDDRAGVVLCTSRTGSIPSPLESLGSSRVLAGAVSSWAPLLCAERNFKQNK